ncbi:hypothetical protein C2S52_009258 [Perilla frutescens var. hirtella]|nr:hypothetical protein C2S51_017237 [Perilla frutescens var. frutescens]KAH6784299.1 hypothetical protein C2S52_009258 [Perilla frutescens var. hirtella]
MANSIMSASVMRIPIGYWTRVKWSAEKSLAHFHPEQPEPISLFPAVNAVRVRHPRAVHFSPWEVSLGHRVAVFWVAATRNPHFTPSERSIMELAADLFGLCLNFSAKTID